MTAEKNTIIVMGMTATMMFVEIIMGIVSGSMALLADGIHMGSHTVALGISVIAYVFARNRARDERFSFGTGKVNALAGYTSAILLGVFALSMAWESIERLFNPVQIAFNQALLVAILGLIINGISVWILDGRRNHAQDEEHAAKHIGHTHQHADHNLRSAYMHVLADAMTSILAIIALLSGKFLGFMWMDALMGLVGAVMVGRWSTALITSSGGILLDKRGPDHIRKPLMEAIESTNGNRISDLHIWGIGPDIFSAAISIVTEFPKNPDDYKNLIPNNLGIVHSTIEVHKCITCE
jgi:cation diffusion facilitator family transporter